MQARKLPWLEPAVLGVVLIALVVVADGGPTWGVSSARAVIATRYDHGAAAPLYDLLASVFSLIPAGAPGSPASSCSCSRRRFASRRLPCSLRAGPCGRSR